MLAYTAFQWMWVVLLVGMVGIAGLFAVYMIAQLFRNPGAR
jgi:hypothetical protein